MKAYSSRLGFAAVDVDKENWRVPGLSPELYILTDLTQVRVCRSINFLNWTIVS